ncbi:hypothetical protein FAIPA1_530010 [Frankia sp. AiPs1]
MAASQLGGESSLAGLDRSRADRAGPLLTPVPFAPSRSAARLAGRSVRYRAQQGRGGKIGIHTPEAIGPRPDTLTVDC